MRPSKANDPLDLLPLLERAMPDWRSEFDSPVEAAVELGLIDPQEGEFLLGGDYAPLDFHDDDSAWQRYYEALEREEGDE